MEAKNERECKKSTPESMEPDPLSERPAPQPGQIWRLSEMQCAALETFKGVERGDICFHDADTSDDWFRVLIGNYPPGDSKIPVLPNLGLYFWYIPPLYDDTQTPHKEDEAYFVLGGRGQICVAGQEKREVRKGDLVFVPRCAPHKFFTPYEGEGLALLIIFSPVYSGGVDPDPPDDSCRDWAYEKRSEAYVESLVERYRKKG